MTAAVQTNAVLAHMVDLEMARIVERWRFQGDAVHILLRLPARGCRCREEHYWFVNRDGRTRCWECDAAYVKERDELFLTAMKVGA
jgi:hypothetical protein